MSSQVIDQPAPPANAAGSLQPCPGCNRTLPIRSAAAGRRFANWECDNCHAPLTGIFVQNAGEKYAERVRLAQSHFDASRADAIPPTLRQLVEQFLIRRREKQEFDERRRNQRVPCDLDAVIIGLDDQWSPCCGPFNAVVIDLAAHGLGMMTAVRIAASQLAIQIQCPTGLVQLIGRNAWSNFVGESFQNTGVEFIARLGRTAVLNT